MVRDYSDFLGAGGAPRKEENPLRDLGWQGFFSQQLDIDTMVQTPPARVTEIHRSGLLVRGDGWEETLPPAAEATVGDWLLVNRDTRQAVDILERKSLIKRRAPGHDRRVQLVAANIDTVFIVTSCNADFNVARLERYLALAFEAGVDPVILLTKADLAQDPESYVAQAAAISERVPALSVHAKDPATREALAPWRKPGQTIAFLGSSGVGKSTLTNTLSGHASAMTQDIREDDAKGRHTTTHRHLHILPGGCAILDTPGMRELQLTEAAEGIRDLFEDLDDLATQCKFSDCGHNVEPDCAVLAAIETGDLDPGRLTRWQKLLAEEAHNSASLAQKRAKDRVTGKTIRRTILAKNKR